MPIQPPQLDDLRYDRTVEDLVRRIPVHTPEWTDVNESDPGRTLIELLAYLTEQIGYRLNRVPEKNQIELLKLLCRRAGQSYLWLGLDYNPDRDAGFRGVRVTLTVQLDDDEQPSLVTTEECGPVTVGQEAPAPVNWLWYYDADARDVKQVPGRID